MANYTGSPLGLISEASFNYRQYNSNESSSRFSTKNTLNKVAENENGIVKHPLTFGSIDSVHSDAVYDIRTANIIEQLDKYPTMRLKWSDFAYCRDYGVYPNNRLVVCRRFDHPMIDDLTFAGKDIVSEPISTLISWLPETDNILSFNFGEVWIDAQPSFKDLLNEVGDDVGLGKINFKLGDALSQGVNLVSLPGFTEGLQRKILGSVGIIGDSKTEDIIPSGTPNLIKESKQRQMIKEDQAGSGLVGKFSVKVKCSWEQKFISGVDPTIIYYDILQTILAFGGSQAVFYLGKRSNLGGLDETLKDYLKPGGATRLIKKVVEAFASSLQKVIGEVKDSIGKFFDSTYDKNSGGSDSSKDQKEVEKEERDRRNKTISGIISSFSEHVIKKYRIQALGVVTTLTGLPSTPWHITIGNPLRPIFSSGDMFTQDVTVNLGPQLAFNDLPSFIECEFTLQSARNLGIDEIMEKLSCSGVRITNEHPTFWNSDPDPGTSPNQTKNSKIASNDNNSDSSDTKDPDTNSNNSFNPFSDKSKVGIESNTDNSSSNGQKINPDPNISGAVL